MTDPLRRLADLGVAVWLDDLSRDRLDPLAEGALARLVAERSVVGVTTNPSIFKAAITKSSRYADQLRALAAAGADADRTVHALTTDDVRAACDLLAPVAARTGGQDGRVSIEVDPRLAHDTAATIVQARELWADVDRENLLIKIPATVAGLPAIRQVVADGISVNVTLIFSTARYREVMDAYLAGLEDRLAAGLPVAGIASVASFFVSRVDTEVDKRLGVIGSPQALGLRGRAAVANARLAYRAYEEVIASPRWQRLARAGAAPQRPLWASTGVKDPAYPDTLYVTELVAPGTVNTMPEATLHAVADHGVVPGESVRGHYANAAQVFDDLAAVGVDLADVARVLEAEGVDTFEVAWNDLLAAVTASLAASSADVESPLVSFRPRTPFFVGIDSDGCAFDAMEIKHKECFTPSTVKHWRLQAVSSLTRETAEFVNLYSTSRGQNRWIALVRVFELLAQRPEVAERGVVPPSGAAIGAFIDSGYPLSDRGIREYAAAHPDPELDRAIAWTDGVNAAIADMVTGVPPFPYVRRSLQAMRDRVDLMVVSATPLEALEREWAEHGLAEYMDVIAGQEYGTKAEHLAAAAKGKYADDHILLIGDAPGDRDAAFSQGVLYYPINPGHEAQSWRRFHDEALSRFLDGSYAGAYQAALLAEFEALLPADPPWTTTNSLRKDVQP